MDPGIQHVAWTIYMRPGLSCGQSYPSSIVLSNIHRFKSINSNKQTNKQTMQIANTILALALLARGGLSAALLSYGTESPGAWYDHDVRCSPPSGQPDCGPGKPITRDACKNACVCQTNEHESTPDRIQCVPYGPCRGDSLNDMCKCVGLAGTGQCGASSGAAGLRF